MVTHKINANRLQQRLEEMSEIGRHKEIGVHRLSLTDEDKKARDLLSRWMKDAGLEVKIDRVGNMYGYRKGANKKKVSPIAFGSHLDTVASGGRFDGALGVLAGLEVIESLNDNSLETERPLVLMNFTNEEGARFAPDMMGSLVVAGGVGVDEVYRAKDLRNQDITFHDELRRIGYLGELEPTAFRPAIFLELHIEQGPVLEQGDFQIGVVNRVQGIRWMEFLLTGEANHAGTTPMHYRKDPSIVMAKTIAFCKELTSAVEGLVATTGMIESDPGVINVIPRKIRFSIDMRCPDKQLLDDSKEKVLEYVSRLCQEEKVELVRNDLANIDPVVFNESVVDTIKEVSKELKLSSKEMVSGAGHDAQLMGRVVPAAMIFIPSEGGISHSIHEFSSPDQIEAGANVLFNSVLRMANT